MTVDAMLAMAASLVLLMMLTITIAHQNRAEKQLAARREAARIAEQDLLLLRSGQAAPSEAKVERLEAAAPAGYAWVRLTVAAGEGTQGQSLVGLVPERAAGGRP